MNNTQNEQCPTCGQSILEDKNINGVNLREICVCGKPWGHHGASFPHDRSDECAGFKPVNPSTEQMK